MNIPPEAIQIAQTLGIAAASFPTVKFLQTIAPAFGRMYEPLEKIIDAKAEAKAEEIKKINEVRTASKIAKLQSELAESVQQRAADRVSTTQIRQQENLESTFKLVPQFLPERVGDESVDEDWFYQFMEYNQTISDEQMQILWAKILAGEITQPGKFSLRTLQFVKAMSKFDAKLFDNLCNYLFKINFNDSSFFLIGGQEIETYLISKGINGIYLAHLKSVGLLLDSVVYDLTNPDNQALTLMYDDEVFSVKAPTKIISKFLMVSKLSDVGCELALLRTFTKDENYLSVVLESSEKRGLKIEKIVKV